PTCFAEITAQTGFDVAACFIDALEVAVMARRSGAAPGFRAG
ncbi:MAG: glutathione synthase, partial [Betaproteobacteria bacterium]